MPYPFKLEFSRDDLSVDNMSCTWINITHLVKKNSLKWAGGTDALGDPAKAGEMSFVLEGTDFVPLHAGSPHFPNVQRRRRFRLSFDRGAGYVPDYMGYARTYQPIWPGNVATQEVEVVCGDGHDLLADPVPTLDPPDAESYGDVVAQDEPWGYWKLGEAEGTVATARIRKIVRGKGKRRRVRRVRVGTAYQTAEDAGGVAGPSGTYKNTPSLAAPGLILGDTDTAVLFRSAQSEYVAVPVEDTDIFVSANSLTVECWVKPTTVASEQVLVSGPFRSASSLPIFRLGFTGSGDPYFATLAGGTANGGAGLITAGVIHHLVGVYDGANTRIYVNAVEEDSESSAAVIPNPDGTFVNIGRNSGGTAFYANGVIDEVAIYERALSPDRVLAHYLAGGSRGWPEQTAGERIFAAADIGVWDASLITASPFTVMPRMMAGQARVDVIDEAMEAEGIRTMFCFHGHGDPFYLPWDFQSDTEFSAVQVAFGAPRTEADEEMLDEQDVVFDDRVYNSFTKSRVGGTAQTATDVDSIALIGQTVEAPSQTELILTDDADVLLLCQEGLATYASPTYAVERLTLHGSDVGQLEWIFELEMGHMIEFRRRSFDQDGNLSLVVDVITWIIGFEKWMDGGGNVNCTYRLARGFNGAEEGWLMGVTGRSELDLTDVLY